LDLIILATAFYLTQDLSVLVSIDKPIGIETSEGEL